MESKLELYDIYPKVVPSHERSTLTIQALDYSVRFEDGKGYEVMILPMWESMQGEGSEAYACIQCEAKENKLQLGYDFKNEQEYLIRVFEEKEKVKIQLSVYAVEPDLYERRPYKGDLHVHTCFSDGKESPEFVVAKYREHGFDFLAITDHHQYEPSLRAIKAYEDVTLGLKLFPGEEVHAPDNHIHIVNFGGDYSVNQLYKDEPDRYRREVEAIQENLTCPEGVNAFHYASCLWVYDHIRKGNGLGIFAHPHWIANVYHVRDAMTKHQLEHLPFDAFELIGGQTVKENNMQVAFYNDMRQRFGRDIPIVGSSDSHGVMTGYLFDQMKTFVLGKSNEKQAIVEAIKAQYSVAVESYKGEAPRVHGSYRMVSYVMFLMENYFPLHDALCYEEGRRMLAYIRGDEEAKESLERLAPRTEKLMDKYFGRYA
ncbi:MAG: PHP domain-containing protein [Cellulosilyticaceae bacterium]